MNLIGIFKAEAGADLRRLIVLSITGAMANTLVLVGIIDAAQYPDNATLQRLLLLLLLLLFYTLVTRHVSRRSLFVFESALHRIKVRIGHKLVRTELDTLEQIDAAEICDRVTENMAFVSDRASIVPSSIQSGLLLVFIAAGISWLCLPALTLILLLVIIAGGLFINVRREFVVAVKQTNRARVDFFARLTDLLDGFKQLKFSRRAADDMQADLATSSAALRAAGVRSWLLLADSTMMTNALLYALLGVIAYVLHDFVALGPGVLSALIAVAIFIRGPLSILSLGLLPYIRANIALDEVARLEAKLERATSAQTLVADPKHDPWPEPLSTIDAHELAYTYPHADGNSEPRFGIGPLTQRFEAGQIVFIVGGNGSGKSTLFKVLAGLYPAGGGELRADAICVTPSNRVCYREQVSAIFGDFHLFRQLHGMPEVSDDEVRRLLEEFGLTGIVNCIDGTFTRLDLSTGQRKRLAMVVALLEDRPVLLFDEWAADQDPSFRRYFYEQLLPRLREAGKIVLAISHDDRYFDVADCVVTMDYGQIREVKLRAVKGRK